jgi:Ca2+-binding RTX toxin-like protein
MSRYLVATAVLGLAIATLPSATAAAAPVDDRPCDGQAQTDGWTYDADAHLWTGTAGDDVIVVYTGDDVDGLGGDDTICIVSPLFAGEPSVVHGGAGNDRIFGDFIGEELYGGPGDDYLYGGNPGTRSSLTVLDGGPGSDVLDASGSPRSVAHFAGVGPVVVDLAKGTARTSDGTDILLDVDDVVGTPRADTLKGDSYDNVLTGGGGADEIVGGGGHDRADGGAGHDACDAEKTVSC